MPYERGDPSGQRSHPRIDLGHGDLVDEVLTPPSEDAGFDRPTELRGTAFAGDVLGDERDPRGFAQGLQPRISQRNASRPTCLVEWS